MKAFDLLGRTAGEVTGSLSIVMSLEGDFE